MKSDESPGLIAYVGTDNNIYTIDPEGEQPTAITQDASLESGGTGRIYQYPTWAPDGRRLAFTGVAGSSPADLQAVLYVASSEGKDRVEAFSSQDDFPFYLFWSPDSEYVTFLSNDSGGAGLALHLAAAGGGDNQIIGTGQPYYWDWSPDSQTIIAHTGGASAINPDARMALIEMNGSGQRTEMDLKPGFFQAPAWSPDGEELILAAEGGGNNGVELVLTGPEGAIKRVLAQVSGPVAFAWSPDGRNLALTTDAGENPQGLFTRLALLDPSRPEDQKDIAQGIVVAFFWSPDSRKIAYFIPDLNDTEGVSSRMAQDGPRLGLKVMIYDLAAGKSQQAAAFEPTGAFLQILPFFDQYHRSGTIWSPDSKKLVLSAIDQEGVSQIIVVNTEGGQPQPIAEGNLAFWSWK